MLVQMDKRVLVDTITYKEYAGLDSYRQPKYGDPETIEFVRIDRSSVFSRDANESKIVANAIVFCYAGLTTPFVEFKEQSLIEFDGKEHVLQKIVPVTNPYDNTLFSYELEVM